MVTRRFLDRGRILSTFISHMCYVQFLELFVYFGFTEVLGGAFCTIIIEESVTEWWRDNSGRWFCSSFYTFFEVAAVPCAFSMYFIECFWCYLDKVWRDIVLVRVLSSKSACVFMKHRKSSFSLYLIDKSGAPTKGDFVRVLSRILRFWVAFIALSPLLGASVLDFMRFLVGFWHFS